MTSKESLENGGEAAAIGRALCRYSRSKSLNQAKLAKILGTSQPTISKLLRGQHHPRSTLRLKIISLLGPSWPLSTVGSDEWIKRVAGAARTKSAFNDLIMAALALMNNNE